jgi:hypothetical protein
MILCLVGLLIACYHFIIRPFIYFKIIYQLPIEQRYRLLDKVNDVRFQGFDAATKIIVSDHLELDPFEVVIDDPEKVELARQFVQRYPDGWVGGDTKFTRPSPVIRVDFYDDDNHFLNGYGIGRDRALIYPLSAAYGNWKLVGKEELRPLIEALDIPEILLYERPNWPGNRLYQQLNEPR